MWTVQNDLTLTVIISFHWQLSGSCVPAMTGIENHTILGVNLYLKVTNFYFSTDSSVDDASILDDNSTRNGESDDGSLLVQPGGRQLITELPCSESSR
jgi:hypothetical protein